jgi:hypothetical protein
MPTIWLLIVMITDAPQGGLAMTQFESEQACEAAIAPVIGWANMHQHDVAIDCLPIKSSGQDQPAPE